MPLTVSTVVPYSNEEKRIRALLDAIFAQTCPCKYPDLQTNMMDKDTCAIPAGLGGALLAFELLAYFGILGLAGLRSTIQHRGAFLLFGLPLATATMDVAWGSGFLWRILAGAKKA